VDSSGEEWEQPADIVLLCAFQLFNVQLLLLSGIGRPYDPQTGKGQIGRNFTHQTTSTAVGFFDKNKYNFNPFIAAGSIGMYIDEFNGDNFDHSNLGFVGGGYIGQVRTNGRPLESMAVPPLRLLGAPNGSRRCATTISARSFAARPATDRSTAIATSISISIPPTKTASAGRRCA
jgi:choline dehydrogenase-like flavoprotein